MLGEGVGMLSMDVVRRICSFVKPSAIVVVKYPQNARKARADTLATTTVDLIEFVRAVASHRCIDTERKWTGPWMLLISMMSARVRGALMIACLKQTNHSTLRKQQRTRAHIPSENA